MREGTYGQEKGKIIQTGKGKENKSIYALFLRMISTPVQSIIIKEAKVSTMKYRKKRNGERKEYKLYYVRIGKEVSAKLEKMGVRRLKNVEIIYQNEKYVLGDKTVRIWSRTPNDNTSMYGFTIPKPIGEKLAEKKVLLTFSPPWNNGPP